MHRLLVVLASTFAFWMATEASDARVSPTARWCPSGPCHRPPMTKAERHARHRVLLHRRHVRHWKRVAAPFASWLRSTSWCESGSSGWYHLTTTGNGFWFAFQFTRSTWRSVGGRVDGITPVGYRGGRVPTHAEQDYRAVRVRWSQGTGAWPVCG